MGTSIYRRLTTELPGPGLHRPGALPCGWHNRMAGALLLVLLPLGLSHAIDKRLTKRFTDSLRLYYEYQYRRCTGDTARRIPPGTFLSWKRRLDPWIRSPEYSVALEEYKEFTGLSEDIIPCEVYMWFHNRHDDTRSLRASLNEARRKHRAAVAESIAVERAYRAFRRRPIDFPRLPFGLSRKVLVALFAHSHPYELIDAQRYFYTERFPVNGKDFLAGFHIDRYGRYYRYELESELYNARNIDEYVRPLCDHLARHFTSLLGPPDQTYRIGAFDIVHGRLAPHSVWRGKDFVVQVGIGTYKYHYYAKARVTVTLPDPYAPSAPDAP